MLNQVSMNPCNPSYSCRYQTSLCPCVSTFRCQNNSQYVRYSPKSTGEANPCTNSTEPEDTSELPMYNHENPISENKRTPITGPNEIVTPSEIDTKNEETPPNLCKSFLEYGEPLTNTETL